MELQGSRLNFFIKMETSIELSVMDLGMDFGANASNMSRDQ